jgi:hypothetical protein
MRVARSSFGGVLQRSVMALALLSCLAMRATALDWREPWVEPHDAGAAVSRSDEYAWRLFVALNWPADSATRGPDRMAPLGADRPVVWEAWQSAASVYREDGADPGPWAPAALLPLAAERRFEMTSSRDFPNLRHIVNGVMVPVADPIANARRLTEIRMNRKTFEFIRAHELYNIEGQVRAYASASAVSFPYGARDVKAKWRPITEGERSRYHTIQVRLADGTQRLYGLTALHIASKDLPHWFWATFEHVDNPTLADSEGWQLPSRDRFACRAAPADCNRAPAGIGLEGTVWQYYRLRGTLSRYTDARGAPERLANSELESGMQSSSSCITCHSRAAIGVKDGQLERLATFDTREPASAADPLSRRGFLGAPQAAWFQPQGQGGTRFRPLDFVWSMTKAQHKSP